MSEKNSNKRACVGKGTFILVIVSLISSLLVHELGHAIAFILIGIPIVFLFDICSVGPVLGVMGLGCPATTLELVFVVAAGPGLAAIVFALLGRFWKDECYVAASFHGCYVPFEVLLWLLDIQAGGDPSILFWSIVMIIIPNAIIINRILGQIAKSSSLN